MKLEFVNPYDVVISTLNERKTFSKVRKPSKGSLERSVANIGVVQPPVVRQLPDGKYEAIIGQRRTLAAQEAGLKEIPVMVVDWEDSTSLAASITENVSDFREGVTARDRAEAVFQLFQLKGWDTAQPRDINSAAKLIGVHPRTIQNWMECGRDEWAGTPLHIDNKDSEELSALSLDKVQTARRVTGGGDRGVEFLRAVKENNLSSHDVREVGQYVMEGYNIDEALEEISTEKQAESFRRLVLKLDSEISRDLDEFSRKLGTPSEKAAVYAIEQMLYGE